MSIDENLNRKHAQWLLARVFNKATDHRPTDHRLTDHQQPTTDPSAGPPLSHQPLNTVATDSFSTDPQTHQTYLNRVTTGPILSLINFNSPFVSGAIYH